MGILTDIRVPLPRGHECRRYLAEMSDRLTSNLRVQLGEEFEVVRDGRPVSFGEQWLSETKVYCRGELRATFAVAYDALTAPRDFEVSCLLPSPAPALAPVLAVAASLALAVAGTAFGGPTTGLLAGSTGLLAISVANRSASIERASEGSDTLLRSLDLKTGLLQLDPLTA